MDLQPVECPAFLSSSTLFFPGFPSKKVAVKAVVPHVDPTCDLLDSRRFSLWAILPFLMSLFQDVAKSFSKLLVGEVKLTAIPLKNEYFEDSHFVLARI